MNVTPARSRWIGRTLVIVGVIGVVLQDRMNVLNQHAHGSTSQWPIELLLAFGCLFMVAVGAVIVARQPGNLIGWLLAAIGFLIEFWSFSQAFAPYALRNTPLTRIGSLPFGALIGWASLWAFPLLVSLFIPIFLLFPNGRPASRRWRPVLWAWAVAAALSVVTFGLDKYWIGFGNGECPPLRGDSIVCVTNPIADPAVRSALGVISFFAGLVIALSAIAALLSVIIRYRRAVGDERQQVKWIAFVGVACVASFLVVATFGNRLSASGPQWVGALLFVLFASTLVIGLPLAIAVAVLKYHLYDLDLVIRKTVVIGVLASFVAVVYAAIVAGVGTLIGSRSNTALSFAAAAVFAIAFQPVRERARRFADRVVYGKRATPYEVLSTFSDRMAGTIENEEALSRMAQILAAGTGAESSTVWLFTGGQMRAAAMWPQPSSGPVKLPHDLSADAVEVRHRGEVLGALSVTMPASDPMDATKQRLVEDLAAQAGVVLRNARLIEELRASRQRLVTAQDQERRKLERNIHDGAQQQLVALSVKLNLLQKMIDAEPEKAKELGASLQASTIEALEDLRDLARGIYPPLLADKGLAVALEAQARKGAVPTTVESEGAARYPQDVEATVYFCALEALQNVTKYANATSATIRLEQADHTLTFEVIDDGTGFDPALAEHGSGMQGMADRLAALDGSFAVRSLPGQGTTVTGRLPAAPLAAS